LPIKYQITVVPNWHIFQQIPGEVQERYIPTNIRAHCPILTVSYTYLEQQLQNLQDLQVSEELVYHKASLSSHSVNVQLVGKKKLNN
jgi:hypothetical protein